MAMASTITLAKIARPTAPMIHPARARPRPARGSPRLLGPRRGDQPEHEGHDRGHDEEAQHQADDPAHEGGGRHARRARRRRRGGRPARMARAETGAAAAASAAAAAGTASTRAVTVPTATQARPRPWRSRCPAVPSGHRSSIGTSTSTTSCVVAGAGRSPGRRRCPRWPRTSPGSSRLSGGAGPAGSYSAAPTSTTATPTAAIPSTSFHGYARRRRVDATRARPASCAGGRGGRYGRRAGAAQRGVVHGPPRRLAEHPVGLVDRGHRRRRRRSPWSGWWRRARRR